MIMKSVIFVTVSMGGGGVERIISILANYFVKHNFDVSIMMLVGNTVSYELDSRIKLVSIGEASGGKMGTRIRRVQSMRRFFKQNRESTVVAMTSVASIFSLIASIGLKNKVVISERNHPDILNGKPYTKGMRLIRDFLYGMADICVLQTYDAKQYFKKRIADKSVVIPNPIPNNLVKPYVGRREKVIVTAGRLVPVKNHQMLLEAFAIFHKEHEDYILKIYGSGELEEELKKRTIDLSIDSSVCFIPFTNQLHQEIKNSSIYVSTSNSEGISNSILEAMALGIPTIATDCPIGGTKMCIENDINGILIPVGDVGQLANSMKKIAENDDFAEKLSFNAVKVRDTFSQDKIISQWMEIIS